jgi:hypothetical protein
MEVDEMLQLLGHLKEMSSTDDISDNAVSGCGVTRPMRA